MYEINLYSSPFDAVAVDAESVSVADVPRLVRYDEDFVKPALLLADRTVLKTTRVDAYLEEFRDSSAATMLIPARGFAFWISESRDREVMDLLGIRDEDLLSPAEIDHWTKWFKREEGALSGSGDSVDESVESFNFAEAFREMRRRGESDGRDFLDRVAPLSYARAAHHRQLADLFQSPVLNALPTTTLRQDPWDPTVRTRFQELLDERSGEDTAHARMVSSLVDSVASSRAGVMLDPAVSIGLATRGVSGEDVQSARRLAGAVELMRMVDGISDLPVDEVVDVREDLAPYLAPFRGFLLDMSGNVDLSPSDAAENARRLQIFWEAEVSTAIDDMRVHVEHASFRRNLLDLFSTSGDTTRTVGTSLGLLVASGFAGLEVVGAAAALAQPALTALIGSVRAKQRVANDRAYFVHALGVRDRRRRSS
ncbi:hypothetical protein [Demequina sp. NBRC 110053]|uniref:hypothetical protein n=1 Tax=Demequina sp. NBRC 110053 TaxID=1570342 RepID=UPI000A00386A|nr:hypothetical protein [Demequina sp. NBRC 110053]